MAIVARRVGALTNGGALAAAVVGFVVFGWGGAAAALTLLVFFGSGSALTRWLGSREDDDRERRDANGRRATQVLANGTVAAAAVVAAALTQHPMWTAAFAGAVATATADTWATEFGVTSKRPPVLITTGRPVPTGRSGAVSLAGTLGGVAGACLIAGAAAVSMALLPWPAAIAVPRVTTEVVRFATAAAVGGIIGMFGDSLLGATVQEYFRCAACGARTEQSVHHCQRAAVRTKRAGGWPGMNNDAVNFVATVIGAAAAMTLFRFIPVLQS